MRGATAPEPGEEGKERERRSGFPGRLEARGLLDSGKEREKEREGGGEQREQGSTCAHTETRKGEKERSRRLLGGKGGGRGMTARISPPLAPFMLGFVCAQVVDMQVLTSDDFPAAVVRQRLQDKASIEAMVEEVR
jgi:hypothetical protein